MGRIIEAAYSIVFKIPLIEEGSTEAALEESIKHWEQVAAAETPREVHLGPRKCALCLKFHHNFDAKRDCCKGCPVQKHTGLEECRGTPYEDVLRKREFWREQYHCKADNEMMSVAETRFRIAANRELEFLKSLRKN